LLNWGTKEQILTQKALFFFFREESENETTLQRLEHERTEALKRLEEAVKRLEEWRTAAREKIAAAPS
jgi:hypothetical protein